MKHKYLNFRNIILSSITLAGVFLLSCKHAPENTINPVTGTVYVVNEGNLTHSNGSISIYNTSTKTAEIDVFKDKNGSGLGDIVQSLTFLNNKAYIVVNNSNKIEVADGNTFHSIATIHDLKLPRVILGIDDHKAYLTEWVSFVDNGRISVINLDSNKVTKTIPLQMAPGAMLKVGNNVYVTNTYSNTISIINSTTDAVTSTINTNGVPNDLQLDKNGKLWVICAGAKTYDIHSNIDPSTSEKGTIQRINPLTNTIEHTYTFPTATEDIGKMCINSAGDRLYFLGSYDVQGRVFKVGIADTGISATPFINRLCYGLGVDPNGENIYAGTYGFISSQKLLRYSAGGIPLDSTTVGIGPNGFVFK